MDHAAGEAKILRAERRWAWLVAAMVFVILAAIVFAGISMHINPPSNREYVDPQTLHLSGEFTEANLGTRVESNGQVTTRVIATQFAFVPQCVVVPADTPVTLRFATPDVIHGILVSGSNVNTMIIPGTCSCPATNIAAWDTAR
jgi:cytochrome c oxidase subunit 2